MSERERVMGAARRFDTTARYGGIPDWRPPGEPGDVPGRRPGQPGAPSRFAASEYGATGGPASWLEQRMFEQQTVAVSGPITPELTSRVSAALMTLDALAGPRGSITMHVSSPDGELAAAFGLIDVLELMQTPVRAVALGTVGGVALGVYAAAGERVAYPHARFVLAEPRVDELAGTAEDVTRAAGAHLRLLEDFAVRLAERTGHSQAEIESALSDRRDLSASAAVDFGLVHRLIPGRAQSAPDDGQ